MIVKLGSELQINTYTTLAQSSPSIVIDSNDNWIITWESEGQDSDNYGIYARKYDSSGNPISAEFPVNTEVSNSQRRPTIANDANGNFTIAWQSYDQDGDNWGIFAQQYDSNGTPINTEFQVNSYTLSTQEFPVIAKDPNGNFVIAWQSGLQDGSYTGVYAQRYDSNGIPQDAEFQVNTYTPSYQSYPTIAMDSNGNFIMAWWSVEDGSNGGIYARRFNPDGSVAGPEFQVNTYTTGFQWFPSIAIDGSGNFTIAWESETQDGDGYGIYARRYDSNGNELGAEFQVNTYTTNDQRFPNIAKDANGGFVISWNSQQQDGDDYGIYAQRYDATGNPVGSEFPVNTYTTGDQFQLSRNVAMDSQGNFVITWSSAGQDGSGWGAYAQKFGNPDVNIIPGTGSLSENNTTPVEITFNLNGIVVTDELPINFRLGGTANYTDDYLLSDNATVNTLTQIATVIIPQGSSSTSLTITPIDDTLIEPTELITFDLIASPEYNLGATATLSLVDNDIPTVNVIHRQDPSEAEPILGIFTLTLDQPALTDITLFYTINPSNATPGTDYIAPSGSILVPAGQTSINLEIIPLDDNIADPDETISITLNSSVSYNLGTSVNATLTILDNDTPGITLDPTIPLTTTEAGATAEPTLRLNSQPIADVIVILNSSDTTEGIISPNALTFTPNNWSTPQTLIITGQDDQIADGDIPYQITGTATSSDPDYQNLSTPIINVTNIDNDIVGVTVTQTEGFTEVSEDNSLPDTYTLNLNTVPLEPVQIRITTDEQLEISSEGNSLSNNITLSFTGTQPQTITVFAINDTTVEGLHTGEITHQIISDSDANYNSNLAIAPLLVSIIDNDLEPTPPIPTPPIPEAPINTLPTLINTPPIANPDSAITLINTPVAIPILANDIDFDLEDIIRIDSFDFTSKNGGTITLDDQNNLDPNDDLLIYTPASNFLGVDTFNYVITDGEATGTATVTIAVEFLRPNIPLLEYTPAPPPRPSLNPVINQLQATANDGILPGTPENDQIIGNEENDVLFGFPGDDNLFGLQGNDRLYGNEGNDFLVGDLGDDLLIGGLGNDALFGDEGDDILLGGPGNDVIFGGQEQDLLQGDGGDDYLAGNLGNDTIYGGEGNDLALGENGEDLIFGNEGNDTLVGGEGNDSLWGSLGADFLSGEEGNDTLVGGEDNDSLLGGAGNDSLVGGLGNDILQGGAGSDTFFLAGDQGVDTIYDFNPDEDVLEFGNNLNLANIDIMQMVDGIGLKQSESNDIFAYVLGITVNEI